MIAEFVGLILQGIVIGFGMGIGCFILTKIGAILD